MSAIDFAAMLAHEKKRARAKSGAASTPRKQTRATGATGGGAAHTDAEGVGAHGIWGDQCRPTLLDVTSDHNAVTSRVRYCDAFLSGHEQAAVIAAIDGHGAEEWLQLPKRRLLNLGGVPHPSGMIAEELPCWLGDGEDCAAHMLARLQDLGVFKKDSPPDQVLLNYYDQGHGIDPHNDGPLYHPVAAIISLGSSAVLRFYRETTEVASVVLNPGSLLVFDGDAYTGLTHGIDGALSDTVADTALNAAAAGVNVEDVIHRTPRYSLTVRRVQKVAIAAGEYLSEDDRKEVADRRQWWARAVSEKAPTP